jgi:hypothetical protein
VPKLVIMIACGPLSRQRAPWLAFAGTIGPVGTSSGSTDGTVLGLGRLRLRKTKAPSDVHATWAA